MVLPEISEFHMALGIDRTWLEASCLLHLLPSPSTILQVWCWMRKLRADSSNNFPMVATHIRRRSGLLSLVCCFIVQHCLETKGMILNIISNSFSNHFPSEYVKLQREWHLSHTFVLLQKLKKTVFNH